MAPRKKFTTINPTAPSADDSAAAAPAGLTPGRRDVTTSAAAAAPGRIAYTWRLTPAEAHQLDALVLRMRADLGARRLDRATVLSALCRLADDSTAVYGAVLAELASDVQTS